MLRVARRFASAINNVSNTMQQNAMRQNVVRQKTMIPSVLLVDGIPYSTHGMIDADNEFLKSSEFWERNQDMFNKDMQEFDTVMSLLNTKNVDELEIMRILKANKHFYKTKAKQLNYSIDQFIPEGERDTIRDDIKKLTLFNNYSAWDITGITTKYNVSGVDVFLKLMSATDKDKYRKLFENCIKPENLNVCFGYVDGVRIKNCFPIKIGSRFVIDTEKCENNFRIISLFSQKKS